MQIISTRSPQAISRALEALSVGELVIYPTETCYGIGADANNESAVSKLLSYKGDRHRQVAIAVSSPSMASNYVALNSMATNLYQQFLPGPITVISASLHQVDPRLESASGTLGIRYPRHDFALTLIEKYGKPITATSANTSGKKEPYSLSDWQKYTSSRKQELVSLFLDAGRLKNRPTSTVVDTTLNSPTILRQGEFILPSLSRNTVTTRSIEATKHIAGEIISKYLPLTTNSPLLLALQGDLGTGKTQFVQGVAHKLKIQAIVSSPTYTLMREYKYSLPKYQGTLYHLDTWRLSDLTELDSTLHLTNLLVKGNILAIEWAGKAKSWLNQYQNDYPILVINIKEIDVSTRQIEYAFNTPAWS